jgi:hypothetical protein
VTDLDSKYRSHFEAFLEPGEGLRGICAASQQKGMFSGGAVAIGITDRRLLIQPLSRRGAPDGEPLSIAPEQIAGVKAGGAGGGWLSPGNIVLDLTANRLEIKTTGGEKLKLMLMRGQGSEALGAWFRGIEAP